MRELAFFGLVVAIGVALFTFASVFSGGFGVAVLAFGIPMGYLALWAKAWQHHLAASPEWSHHPDKCKLSLRMLEREEVLNLDMGPLVSQSERTETTTHVRRTSNSGVHVSTSTNVEQKLWFKSELSKKEQCVALWNGGFAGLGGHRVCEFRYEVHPGRWRLVGMGNIYTGNFYYNERTVTRFMARYVSNASLFFGGYLPFFNVFPFLSVGLACAVAVAADNPSVLGVSTFFLASFAAVALWFVTLFVILTWTRLRKELNRRVGNALAESQREIPPPHASIEEEPDFSDSKGSTPAALNAPALDAVAAENSNRAPA